MLDKHFVESFLHLNNIAMSAPDEQLHEAFTKAGWSKTEIDRAFKILHNEDPTVRSINATNVATELLRPGRERTSQDLSLLLGVDVVIDPQSVRGVHRGIEASTPFKSFFLTIFAFALSITVAYIIGSMLMYYTKVGPYYSPI